MSSGGTPIIEARREQMLPTLSDHDFARLKRFGSVRSFPKGAFIMKTGEVPGGLAFVVSGATEVRQGGAGSSGQAITRQGPGQFLGELAQLSGRMDAWFLDGFSPARNPQMWEAGVFEAVARHSRPGATFATSSTPNPGPVTVSGVSTVAPAAGLEIVSRFRGSLAPVTIHAWWNLTRWTTTTGCNPPSDWLRPSVTSAVVAVWSLLMTWSTSLALR